MWIVLFDSALYTTQWIVGIPEKIENIGLKNMNFLEVLKKKHAETLMTN